MDCAGFLCFQKYNTKHDLKKFTILNTKIKIFIFIFQAGFPVINVEIVNDKVPVEIKVSQERFLSFEDRTIKKDKSYR